MPAESKEALINSFDTVKCCAKDESSWDGICKKNTKIEEDVLPSGWRVILMAPCALSDLQTITSKATRDGFLCPEHAAAVERLLWEILKADVRRPGRFHREAAPEARKVQSRVGRPATG